MNRRAILNRPYRDEEVVKFIVSFINA